MQFSLRGLLGVVTGLSIVAGLTVWLGVLGFLIGIALLGTVAIGYGVASNERACVYAGIAIVAGIAGVLCYDMSGRETWDGEFTLTFDVTVVDAQSGRPLTPVAISLENWAGTVVHAVDEQGRATFSETFLCGGTDSLLRITASSWKTIPLDSYTLTVTDQSGRAERFSLAEAVGRSEWPLSDPSLPPIRLKLP